MTWKLTTLTLRTVSAVVALVILAGFYLYLKVSGLLILISLGTFLSILEYNQMFFSKTSPRSKISYLFPIFSGLLFYSFTRGDPFFLGLGVGLICLYFCLHLVLSAHKEANIHIFESLGKSCLGFFYVAALPALIFKTVQLKNGDLWFFLTMTLVFLGDIFAYFGGKALGKRLLAPDFSPKKTLEGSFFGFLGSCSGSLAFGLHFFENYSAVFFLVLGLMAGGFAQMGDLFESLVKRISGVKDSGRIMPGHGGILDRIDGLLFAAPVVYLFSFYS